MATKTQHHPNSHSSFAIRGRVVVLTGAASGIGAALALALAAEGADLALIDRDSAGLGVVAEAARQNGRQVRTYLVDLTDPAAIVDLPHQVMDDLGLAAVLINNAGIALAGTFEQVSAAQFEGLFAINFFSMVGMTRAFLPHLKQQAPAQIMNMSSIFGIIGAAGQVAYSASKFAVRGFSESLRPELTQTDVGVSVIHPGGVRTNIALSALYKAGLTEEQIAAVRGAAEAPLRMDPREAATRILVGLKQRQKRILVGKDAKKAALVQRLYPTTYESILAGAAERRR